MASRVISVMASNPKTSFFFAFGAGIPFKLVSEVQGCIKLKTFQNVAKVLNFYGQSPSGIDPCDTFI